MRALCLRQIEVAAQVQQGDLWDLAVHALGLHQAEGAVGLRAVATAGLRAPDTRPLILHASGSKGSSLTNNCGTTNQNPQQNQHPCGLAAGRVGKRVEKGLETDKLALEQSDDPAVGQLVEVGQ